MAARTVDDHHVVIDGRRWRASDPCIPATLRQELVDELMAARRAVAAAQRRGAGQAVRDARARVQDAKVALGERGHPWWERDVTDDIVAARVAAAMRALLRHRAPTSSICPSDVARVVGGEAWRARMALARAVAFDLQAEGVVEVRAKGRPVTRLARGPIRIARGPRWPADADE